MLCMSAEQTTAAPDRGRGPLTLQLKIRRCISLQSPQTALSSMHTGQATLRLSQRTRLRSSLPWGTQGCDQRTSSQMASRRQMLRPQRPSSRPANQRQLCTCERCGISSTGRPPGHCPVLAAQHLNNAIFQSITPDLLLQVLYNGSLFDKAVWHSEQHEQQPIAPNQ